MRILGLVVFVVGVVLMLFGWNSSQAITEKVVEGVTGRYTSQTMWFLIGGIAMTVAGLALLIFGGSKR